jgi:predicted Ser/Thr protein kinase
MNLIDGQDQLRILRAVERFEDAWRGGETGRLENLIEGWEGPARFELLGQALAIEVEYRRRRGEVPRPEEYERRFPTFVEVVRSAFCEKATESNRPATTSDTVHFELFEPAATAPGPETAEQFGKYEVIGRLGGGGQGSAFLARDRDLGRLVVLKRYHASGEEAANEGRALCRVRSRFTAQCHDLLRHRGEVFLVMEYIPGRSLSEFGRESPMAPGAAARLIEQVAEGLEAVHACGLVHRDVKPSNIVVGDDGVPRLVDFGLAAHLGSHALRGVSGSPPFMAPEQARDQWERIDARTDLYGLGAVLYALLTGQAPHPGLLNDALEHARQGLVTPPREMKSRRPSPRGLEVIVMKALEADPARRFATAAEMRAALRRHRHRPWVRAAVAVLTLAIVAGAQALAWPRPWSNRPAPTAPASHLRPAEPTVRIDAMELEHIRDRRTSLGTIGVSDTTPCRADDDVRIRVRLNGPAYCYLIALHPDGTTQLYHPESDASPPQPSDLLSYPLGNDLSPLTDGVGLQAFVLVAARDPLPSYSEWLTRLGSIPWGRTSSPGIWHYDGRQFERLPRRRSAPRTGAEAVPALFESACRALADAPGVDAIDAWAFPVAPGEVPATAPDVDAPPVPPRSVMESSPGPPADSN